MIYLLSFVDRGLGAGTGHLVGVVSSAFARRDVDRIKARLLGTSRDKQEDKRPAKRRPALIAGRGSAATGKLVRQLLTQFNLQERLQELLEQAGMKWNVARLIHGCLAAVPGGFRRGLVLPAAAASRLPSAGWRCRSAARCRFSMSPGSGEARMQAVRGAVSGEPGVRGALACAPDTPFRFRSK